MRYAVGLLGAHVAVFFLGIAGVLAAVSGFDAWHVTSYRVTLGAAVLLLGLALRRRPLGVTPARAWACLGMGLLLSVHWYMFFLSLELLGVMLGYAMTGTQPLLIALFARLLLGERLDRKTATALAIAGAGFALLAVGAGAAPNLWLGIGVSLGSFVLFALLILFNRVMVQHTSPLVVTTLEMVGAVPLTLVMTLPDWAPADTRGWAWAVVLGFVCTGLAYVLYNRSMKVLPAPVAGLLLSLEVVYGIVGGYLIGDSLTAVQAVAVVLIANILFFDLWGYLRYRRGETAALGANS